MEKIKLTEDLSFSRLIVGLMRLPSWGMNKEERLTFIKKCIELGITTFDQADIYGDYTSEALFGDSLSLQPSLRDNIEIVTKCGIKLISNNRPEHGIKYYDTSKEHIVNSVNTSLKNMETDYIDVLLIHRPDPLMSPEEVAEAFYLLKQSGKVRQFGVSNFTASQFDMLQSYMDAPLVTNQVEASVAHLKPFLDGTIDHCLMKRIAPMAWSPFCGGSIFTGNDEKSVRIRKAVNEVMTELGVESPDQLLLAWLLNHPSSIMPIIGSGKLERIKTAVDSLSMKITREHWYRLWTASTGHEVA